MDNSLFLQHLREASLEEGRTYIQEHIAELADHDAIGDWLADDALKQLYNPFVSLKLAELLIFFGEYTHHLPSHALGLKAKGDVLVQIWHNQAAMESLDAAGEEFLRLGDKGNWARSRISWIAAAASLGRVEEALQQAARARDMFLRLGEPYWACAIDHNTAWIYRQIGRYHDANVLYERMLMTYPTLMDQSQTFIKRSLAMAEESQAINLSWLGEFERAYHLPQQAQASFVALAETSMTVNSEINLANFDYTQGYYGSALRRYYQAQDILIQNNIDNPKMLAELKLQMAQALIKLNRANEASTLAYEAVEIYRRQLGASLHASNALREYATTLVASGRLNEALAALDEAQALFDQGGFSHHASATRLQRAELLLQMGSVAEAYDEARIVKEYFETHGLVARSVRASLVMVGSLIAQAQQPEMHREKEQQAVLLQDMIALCLQQRRTEQAFGYLERARSMALRQYLNISKRQFDEGEERRGEISTSKLQANSAMILRTQGELKSWQERYRRYSVLLAQLDTSVSPTVERGIIEAELKRCEAKLSELFERLYLLQSTAHLSPQVKKSQKRSAKQLDVTQLRQRLSPDHLLLAYFLYKGRLVIFVLTAEHIITHEIPDGMRQLKRLLPFLHAHLQPGGWPNPQQPPHQGVRSMLNKLYNLLIAPVAALLPPLPGYLTIVPYGLLHTLPFHALYDGSHFLIENYQVNYLPASSLLKAPARSAPTVTPREEQGDHFTEPAPKPPLVFGYSGHGHLQRALEEARTVAAMLGGLCYLEAEATISGLIEEASGSPIIHLATHGHSRLDAPNFSSVLLADGYFNAIDAFSLDLKGCELVTLSGCETGLALSGGGDEQLGLGRAFLAAGASTLVMSLWPVEDNATNELMQLFYQNLLRGESKVQALRAAQSSLIHRTSSIYTHPYYWAAFRLVGDVGPLKFYGLKDHVQVLPCILPEPQAST